MRQQADRDLLAGRRDHVELAQHLVGVVAGAAPSQARAGGWSRRSSPRARRRAGGPRAPTWPRACDVLDALGRAHRGAAVLVNDQCHRESRALQSTAGTRGLARAAGRDSSDRPRASVARASQTRQPRQCDLRLAVGGDRACVDAEPGTNTSSSSRQHDRPAAQRRRDAARLVLQLERCAPAGRAPAWNGRRGARAAAASRSAASAAMPAAIDAST